MSLTLDDLRIHYRPKDGLPNQIKQRRVTLADLVEVIKSEGGEIRYRPDGTKLLVLKLADPTPVDPVLPDQEPPDDEGEK